jgi:CBS domain-containing protein
MPTDHLPLSDAGPTVRDAMMFEPRATPAGTTLAEARETFANPHVKLLLVTDGERFLGTLTRDDLPAEGDGDIGDHVNRDSPRIDPGAPVADAVRMLDGTGTNRLPVVDDGGALLGLVCWDREGRQFCVDPGRVSGTAP